MGLTRDNLMIRRVTNAPSLFELVEISYEQVLDDIGVKESKRIDTIVFTGTIIECKAYIDLHKEGWFVKLK